MNIAFSNLVDCHYWIQKYNAHINPKPLHLKWFGVPKANIYFHDSCASIALKYWFCLMQYPHLGVDENDPTFAYD